jgi:hypothetical protein
MKMSDEKHLIARVIVPTGESAEALAARLTLLMPGFVFEEDLDGRYDEVPAFIAESGGSSFVLFDTPEGEHADWYDLEFTCTTEMSIEELLDSDAGGFLRRFVTDKPPKDGIFLNFSEELSELLVRCGIPGCIPRLPVRR